MKKDYYIINNSIYQKKPDYKYYKENNTYKSYEIISLSEYNEFHERNHILKKTLRKIEYRERKEYEIEHFQGYCEKCFCLKSLNGKCPICGE